MNTAADKSLAAPTELPAGQLIKRMAVRFGVDEGKLVTTLKATAFKVKQDKNSDQQTAVTNEQMMALMVVADQYGLNPFTREIFAFPDKQNGIVPVVSVDGWSRIINADPNLDGIEFNYSDELATLSDAKECPKWCDAIFYRKDRAKPIVVREYLDEVYRAPFKGQYGPILGPWQSHTKRMLRHKALIQGARIAFGFGGIFDQDEADRIIEGEVIRTAAGPAAVTDGQKANAALNEGVDAERRAHVIADLAARADEGIEALDATWNAMSEDDRIMVGPQEFDRIKALAQAKLDNKA